MSLIKMNTILRLVGFLVVLVPHVTSQPVYSITAPNTIQPNSAYNVVVSHHNAGTLTGVCTSNSTTGELLHVVVRILGRSYQGTNDIEVVKKQADLPPASSQSLYLQIPVLNKDLYTFEVNGRGAAEFNHAAQLSVNRKEVSVFIQMDKTIYQLGQTVRFRVVVTDKNLLPHGNDPLEVFINDADNNRIQQWNVIVPQNGIFQGNFQLSTQPVLGSWLLSATTKGATVQNSFTVSEYVLPRFEVTLQSPATLTTTDKFFVNEISALYTFGGPVTGSFKYSVIRGYCPVAFTARPAYSCGTPPINVTGQISGSTQVRINLADLYSGGSVYGDTITAYAEVTEQSTGITRNTTLTFQIYYVNQYLSVIVDNSFKPNLVLPVTVQLQQQSGLPVTNADGVFNVSYYFSRSSLNTITEPTIIILNPAANGAATFNVVPPVGVDYFSVQASYKTLVSSGASSLADSLSDKYLTISVSNSRPSVGCTVIVTVKTTFKMSDAYFYEVVGRGSILTARRVQLIGSVTSATFSIKLTREMAPHVRIVVFYSTPCGELVGDSIDLPVDGLIQTPVTLKFSNATVEPGQNLTLEITSRPNSDVALSGVDQSVLLLSAAQDITEPKIYSDILAYDIGNGYDITAAGLIRRPNYGGSFEELFSFAGLLFFSNGLRSKANICYRPLPIFAKGGGFGGVDVLPVLELAGSSDLRPSLVQPSRVRTYFPESWIWSISRTGANGKVKVPLVAPDTLTTYVTTGFAVSYQYGLGVTKQPANVTIFRPFFIVANLPFSVVRQETVSIQVQIFNNLDVKLDPAIVTLNNTKGEFVIAEGQGGTSISRSITIGANQVGVATFLIRPTKVGYIKLPIKAVSPYAGDAVENSLLVRAEGSPQYFTRSVLIDLRKVRAFATSIVINISANAVPGSEFIEVQLMANIMASFAANIDNLIGLPSGCGEQNMLYFAPDVVILNYLDAANLLTNELKTRLVNYLLTGYQTELTYKRSDGSFSAFGQSDASGSTWLTAFVYKSFIQARAYITIDTRVLSQAEQFITSKQRPNGEFYEDGRVIHQAMQGGSAAGYALTAYILISLQQDKASGNRSNATVQAISNGLRYLEFNYQSSNSTYDACIIAYALHLSNSSLRNAAFARINTLRTVQGEFIFWHVNVTKPSGSDWYYNAPASYDIEATGYCLLTYIYRKESTDSVLPIVRWLLASRSSLGGFSSSQDTVIGIEALAAFAPSIATTSTSSLQVVVTTLRNVTVFNLTKQNELVLQKLQLPSDTRTVQVAATGNGVGILQVNWNYNIIKNVSRDPSFRVIPTVSRRSSRTYKVDICQTYLLDGNTNMVITQLDALSGYSWDQDNCASPNGNIGLSRVEFSQGGTSGNFYFDEIPKSPNQVCFSCSAVQNYVVTNLQPAMIATYDYYESAKRTEVFYNA